MSGSTFTAPAPAADATVSVDPNRIINKLTQKVGELTTQHTFLSTAFEQVSDDLSAAKARVAQLETQIAAAASSAVGTVQKPFDAAATLLKNATDDAEQALGLAANAQASSPPVATAALEIPNA